MNTVYVLVLTFFLHGGNVVTQTTVQHSQEDCLAAQPLMANLYRENKIRLAIKEYTIDYLDARCFEVVEQST